MKLKLHSHVWFAAQQVAYFLFHKRFCFISILLCFWHFCLCLFVDIFFSYFSELLRIWQLQVKFNLTGRVMNVTKKNREKQPKTENWKMAAGSSQVAKNKAFYGHKTDFELWLFSLYSIWIFSAVFPLGKCKWASERGWVGDDRPKLMMTINNYWIIEIEFWPLGQIDLWMQLHNSHKTVIINTAKG